MKLNSKIKGVILILLGSLSIMYSIAAVLFHVNFAMLFSVIGFLIVFLGIISAMERHQYFIKKYKRIYKFFKIALSLLLTSLIIVEIPIVYYGFKKDTEKTDYIVILGAGLWGETPSLALVERLDESLKAIEANPEAKIVVSGGIGPGESITEAEAMKRYLIKNGVEENRIIKEDKSRSTAQNLEFTKQKIKPIEGNNIKILLITNNFHMFRAKLIAKHYGFNVYGSPSTLHPLLVPAYYVREYMAVIKTVIFDIVLK